MSMKQFHAVCEKCGCQTIVAVGWKMKKLLPPLFVFKFELIGHRIAIGAGHITNKKAQFRAECPFCKEYCLLVVDDMTKPLKALTNSAS